MTPLSIAIVGYWHVHAIDYATQLREAPGVSIAGVWDGDEERGRAGAAELGVPFIADLSELLARPDLDAIVVTTATADHTTVIGAALAAGKHVFTEKLLAPTVAECEQLAQAARVANLRLGVSLPRLREGTTRAIEDILARGDLGQVTYCRVRLAHDGSVAGWLPERFYNPNEALGGALTDLGCHAVYLTQRFLGPHPSTVTAVYGAVTGQPLEDNAVVTVSYPGGALAVIESSNVTTPGASTIELRGTEGSLVFGFAGLGLLAKGNRFDPNTWQSVPTPPDGLLPIERWLATVREPEAAADGDVPAAIELTRLVHAANAAAALGRTLDYRAYLNDGAGSESRAVHAYTIGTGDRIHTVDAIATGKETPDAD